MDLVSMISGSAQDFKLVLDYLPAYLPRFSKFYNIMAGVSLGGHTAWRISSLASPGQIHAYCIVVGSPRISDLLVDRLGICAHVTRGDKCSQDSNYDEKFWDEVSKESCDDNTCYIQMRTKKTGFEVATGMQFSILQDGREVASSGEVTQKEKYIAPSSIHFI